MIITGWGDYEKTILIWKFRGAWNLEEYEQALIESLSLTKEINTTYTVLLDLRYSLPPDDLFAIAQHGLHYWQMNPVDVIVVGTIAKWKSMYAMAQYVTQTRKNDIQFVETIDAAYQLFVDKGKPTQASLR